MFARLLFLDRIFSEQPSDAQTFTRLAEADEAKPFTAGAKSVAPTEQAPEEQVRRLMQR